MILSALSKACIATETLGRDWSNSLINFRTCSRWASCGPPWYDSLSYVHLILISDVVRIAHGSVMDVSVEKGETFLTRSRGAASELVIESRLPPSFYSFRTNCVSQTFIDGHFHERDRR